MVTFQDFLAACEKTKAEWFTVEIFLNDWSEWTLSLTELAVKLLPLVTDGALVCWAVIHSVSPNKEKMIVKDTKTSQNDNHSDSFRAEESRWMSGKVTKLHLFFKV